MTREQLLKTKEKLTESLALIDLALKATEPPPEPSDGLPKDRKAMALQLMDADMNEPIGSHTGMAPEHRLREADLAYSWMRVVAKAAYLRGGEPPCRGKNFLADVLAELDKRFGKGDA